jgi:Regulator of chromosome condensation (RCC1) repeat
MLAGGDGRIRCWGSNPNGELGLGHTDPIGDDEPPAAAGDVSVGGPVKLLQAFSAANCVTLENGTSRCWGSGPSILGYANPEDFGDDETAGGAPPLVLGGQPRDLAGGPKCATMSDGSLRCWGLNSRGQLGYGHTNSVGSDGDIMSAGRVHLGAQVAKVARGWSEDHACALLVDGQVRCWGNNEDGQLGLGHQENVGDDERPGDVPAVRVLE